MSAESIKINLRVFFFSFFRLVTYLNHSHQTEPFEALWSYKMSYSWKQREHKLLPLCLQSWINLVATGTQWSNHRNILLLGPRRRAGSSPKMNQLLVCAKTGWLSCTLISHRLSSSTISRVICCVALQWFRKINSYLLPWYSTYTAEMRRHALCLYAPHLCINVYE